MKVYFLQWIQTKTNRKIMNTIIINKKNFWDKMAFIYKKLDKADKIRIEIKQDTDSNDILLKDYIESWEIDNESNIIWRYDNASDLIKSLRK